MVISFLMAVMIDHGESYSDQQSIKLNLKLHQKNKENILIINILFHVNRN